ncbi:MAG TPA: ferredoxin [Patescibacteria group bacterium]|nr:ferredoxin [Patescibacteria group bacterium]
MSTITVDKNKCIGCGSCAAMYPELFKLGEDGKSEVISSDYSSHNYTKEEIIAICPVEAISIKD